MASIIRGTTPTLIYKFKIVRVSEIATAILTIKQADRVVIEKTLNSAVTGADSLSWTFTQQETLSLEIGSVSAMLNWVTSDGTRGASKRTMVAIELNDIEEVI